MARIGGRNSVMAWAVGVGCAAVIAALVVVAAPGVPTAVTMVGETLREAKEVPAFAQRGDVAAGSTTTPECRALYTEAMWAQLTQRAGGDPVQDQTLPDTPMASALAPKVRVSCAFTGASVGRIVTTVSDVSADAAAVARAGFEADGFGCDDFGDGVRCIRSDGTVVQEDAVRDGIWVSTTFDSWQPPSYLERMARQLWP